MSRDEPPSVESSLQAIKEELESIDNNLDRIAIAMISLQKGLTEFLESYVKILSQQGLV